ncbi:MAG: hypothetical protein QM783_16225 [Phycisphaerales bacterium]
MPARANTFVEITPTRLELAVLTAAGVVQQRRTERYTPPAPGADWAETLRTRHATLAGWVSELGLKNASTTVIFASPTAVAALPACPAAAGQVAVERAAVLALAESAGYPIADNPVSTAVLFTDPKPVEKPGQTAPQRMSHALCAVETDANCTLLNQWIASCGLTPARLIPAAAAPIARTVHAVTSRPRSETGTPHAALWFGEHESFFIVGDCDGLLLFRALSVGVENIVEALLRPITPRNADGALGEPITLDRAAARSLLDRTGVPLPTDTVDERNGFTGASILPLMNSVLQRFSVEIKQSLRFGVTDKQRTAGSVTVTLDGPGASLPRIDAALTQFCGVTVLPPAFATPAADRSSAACGNINAAAGNHTGGLTLTPAAAQQALAKVRIRRALRTGVAFAAAAVALYGGWVYTEYTSARDRAESLRAQAAQAGKLDEAERATSNAVTRANTANTYVARAMGNSPDSAAVLALLGETTDARTSLDSIDIRENDTGWTCRLSGTMQAGGGDDKAFADAVKAYTEALAKSPLIAAVKLGAASRTKVGDANAHRFDLTLELVDVPYPVVAPKRSPTPSTEPASEQPAYQPGRPLLPPRTRHRHRYLRGAYLVAVEPIAKKAADAQAEADTLALTISKAQSKPLTLDPARAEQAKRALEQIEQRSLLAGDQARLLQAVSTLADSCDVRVEQFNPANPRGPRLAPGQSPPKTDKKVEQRVAFSISLSGSFASTARFLRAMQQDVGFTTIKSVHMAPVSSSTPGAADTVSVTIETEHLGVNTAALTAPSPSTSPTTTPGAQPGQQAAVPTESHR